MNSSSLVKSLGLEPLEGEGGYYRRVFTLTQGGKELSSTIYYLITKESFSSLHLLPTDEIWYFLEGDALQQVVLHPDGSWHRIIVGLASKGFSPLSLVPGGYWQGTKLVGSEGWALCATTMCPPFERATYRQGTRSLLSTYPDIPELEDFLDKEVR